MLTAFNITLQDDFWWYQKKAVPLHRHSEQRLLTRTKAANDYSNKRVNNKQSLTNNH